MEELPGSCPAPWLHAGDGTVFPEAEEGAGQPADEVTADGGTFSAGRRCSCCSGNKGPGSANKRFAKAEQATSSRENCAPAAGWVVVLTFELGEQS